MIQCVFSANRSTHSNVICCQWQSYCRNFCMWLGSNGELVLSSRTSGFFFMRATWHSCWLDILLRHQATVSSHDSLCPMSCELRQNLTESEIKWDVAKRQVEICWCQPRKVGAGIDSFGNHSTKERKNAHDLANGIVKLVWFNGHCAKRHDLC